MRVLVKAFGEPVSRKRKKAAPEPTKIEQEMSKVAAASKKVVKAAVAPFPVAMLVQLPPSSTFQLDIGEACAKLTQLAGVNCHVHPMGMYGVALMVAHTREQLVAGMQKLIKSDILIAPADSAVKVQLCNLPKGIPATIAEACLAMTEKVAYLGCSAHLIEGFDHPLGGPLVAVVADYNLGNDRLIQAALTISTGLDEDDLHPSAVTGRVSQLRYKE